MKYPEFHTPPANFVLILNLFQDPSPSDHICSPTAIAQAGDAFHHKAWNINDFRLISASARN